MVNEYLQTLHIDLGGTSGKQDKKLIDEISSYLLQQPNTVMKSALLDNIDKFENTIRKTMDQLARKMIEGFYLSKTADEKKELQIDKLLELLTSINNFIQQQKTYAQEISISSTKDTTFRNNLKTIKLRLDELKINAHTARLQAERLATIKATRSSFTRLLNERMQAAREVPAREPPAPAREPIVMRSTTQKAAQSSETGIPYSESIEFEPEETTKIPVASGRKKRKIKYTKKKYNKVSRKRYTKVSNKRYNNVSNKRYNKVSSKRYNKVSRKNGNYNKQ